MQGSLDLSRRAPLITEVASYARGNAGIEARFGDAFWAGRVWLLPWLLCHQAMVVPPCGDCYGPLEQEKDIVRLSIVACRQVQPPMDLPWIVTPCKLVN